MLNKNNISGAITTWLIVVLIVVAAAGVIVWQFLKQPAVPSEAIPQPTEKLTYFQSVQDNEFLALDGAHEFWLKDNYLFVTSIREGFSIFDISDPAEPKHVAAVFNNDEILLKAAHSVMFYQDYAFVSAAKDNAIQVFDISNPTNPIAITAIKEKIGGLAAIHLIAINDHYLYSGGMDDDTLGIWDISNPKNPKHIISIRGSAEFPLKHPHGLGFKENYVYIAWDGGLEVLDNSNPLQPKYITAIKGLDGAHDLEIVGNYLYTISYRDGLDVFDISRPEAPVRIATIVPSEENGLLSSSDGDIAGNYLFVVSEGSHALTMIDISNPSNPTVKDVLRDDGTTYLYNGHFVRVIGDYVYVAGLQDGFGIVKIEAER